MILIYTDYEMLRHDHPTFTHVLDNNSYFEAEVNPSTDIDLVDFELMSKIDGIKFYGDVKSVDNALSVFGPVRVTDLSTGCKTAINLHHAIRDNMDTVIDLTSCGYNAIEECFKLADDTGKIVSLQHSQLQKITGSYTFCVNGKVTVSTIMELAEIIMEVG